MDAGFELKVAAPCAASWADMDGDERARFCGLCKKNVFNLSDMTRDEALALVREVEGGSEVCGRFYQRADGTVLTRNCPVGWRRRLRRRLAFTAAMFAGFFGLIATARAAVRSREDRGIARIPPSVDFWPVRGLVDLIAPEEPPVKRVIMGKIACPPTPPPPATPPPTAPTNGD